MRCWRRGEIEEADSPNHHRNVVADVGRRWRCMLLKAKDIVHGTVLM